MMLQAHILSFTDITYVPVSPSTGRVEAVDIVSAIKANTVMVTVMLANNETGIVQVSQYAKNMLYLCMLHAYRLMMGPGYCLMISKYGS